MNLQTLKIIRDLWGNKARTSLVILTIAIGVFAVSSIARAGIILSTNLTDNYLSATPASATIFTTRTFNEDVVKQVAKMPEVALAEGRNGLVARVQVGPDRWRLIRLIVRDDFDDLLINTISLDKTAVSLPNAWPPPNDTMLLERSSMAFVNLQTGQTALIRLPNGRETQLSVTGVVHDVTQISTLFSYVAYAYITPETYFHLTGIRDFNALDIVVDEHPDDKAHIREVVAGVSETLQKNGYIIREKEIPEPQKHDLDNIIQSVLLLLSILAVLAVFLSAFLVVNSISALLAQQMPQIGTIKAIGGRSRGIAIMYLSSVFILGSIAFVIAVPAGILMSHVSSTFIAGLINFDITNYTVTPYVFALEFFASLLIPLLAAYVPIYSGTRITVREAISQAGTSSQFGTSGLERLFSKMRGMPSPVLYAFRNVFRRKVRLVLTVLTLSVAGAIFIAIISVRASLELTIDQISAYWQEDVSLRLSSTSRMQIIEPIMASLPEVTHYEGRLILTGFRIRPDGSESTELISLVGVAVPTKFIEPSLISGRWLRPEDQNSIVINIDLLTIEPDLAVGDEVTFRLGRRETKWQVVGIVTSQVVGSGELLQAPLAYVPYSSLARAVGQARQINQLLIETPNTSQEQQDLMAIAIEKAVEGQNLRVAAKLLHGDLRDSLENAFEIILSLVQLMSLLFAMVGALGLTGLMTLSVLERTREVGVIRVVGGVRRVVAQIIVIEGVFVGLLSWLIGSLLAWPLSVALTQVLGETLLQVPLVHTFPWYGLLFWLILVIILAIFASLLPALNASKLSVRETMAYE